MSKKAIDGVLRRELGFDGVVISDDLEMKAVYEGFAMAEVVAKALDAGVDAFLVCHQLSLQHEVVGHIVRAVESGRVHRSRLEQAAHRMEKLRHAYACAAGAIDPIVAARMAGSENHRELAARVARSV